MLGYYIQVAALVSTLTPDQVAAKQAEVVEAVSLQVTLHDNNVTLEDIIITIMAITMKYNMTLCLCDIMTSWHLWH